MNTLTDVAITLEQRVSRLEGALGWRVYQTQLQHTYFWIAFAIGVGAFGTALNGFGIPNHLYQFVFGLLSVSYLYHQGLLAAPKRWWQLALFVLNTATMTLVFKLVIGSGRAQPLAWFQLPKLNSIPKQEGQWFGWIPGMQVEWQESWISGVIVDLTMLQTFLLILIIFGMVLSFQLLSSLLALALLFLSIPAYLTFSWPWILPAVILFGMSLYLQLSSVNRIPVGIEVLEEGEAEEDGRHEKVSGSLQE